MRASRSLFGSGAVAVLAMAALVAVPAPSAAVDVSTCGSTLSTPGSYQLVADLTCPGAGAAITVSGSGVQIDLGGHTLAGDAADGGVGVRVDAATGFSVTNGTITAFEYDLRVDAGSADGRIAGITASGAWDESTGDGTFYGLYVRSATDVVVEGNTINGTAFGIQLTAAALVPLQRVTVRGNHVSGAAITALDITGGSEPNPLTDNTIEGNSFVGSGLHNIQLGPWAQGNRIAGNRLSDAASTGLHIASIDVRDNVVEGNRITGNTEWGIRLTDAMEGPNTFRANVVLGNGVDIHDESVGADCGLQVYDDNVFETDIEGDGPAAGCIRGRLLAPLAVATSALPRGTVGQPYAATLEASGGLPPYTWSLVKGALPPGLSLTSSGAIAGTPQAPAQRKITVRVTDTYFPPTTLDRSLTLDFVTGRCAGRRATIVGTSGADRLVGTPGADVIVARGGDDVVVGRGGADIICAGGGHDVVRGGVGNDRIDGGLGRDTLRGARGADVLEGRRGADDLWGGRGRDILQGGPQRDLCVGGAGVDRQSGCELSSR